MVGLLNTMNSIAHNIFEPREEPKVKKISVPLGLHHGSVVTLPDVDIALAQADGSIIEPPTTNNLIVAAIGVYKLFNKLIYNVYLSDGKSYIRIVTPYIKNQPEFTIDEVSLWCNNAEILPQDKDDWEFWLGAYQKDNAGEYVHDSKGIAIKSQMGLIGATQFQIDGEPPVVYDRSWQTNVKDDVDAVKYFEVITDVNGYTTNVNHEGMEYSRTLQNNSEEFLSVSMNQTSDDNASVNVFIGIKIDKDLIKVLEA